MTLKYQAPSVKKAFQILKLICGTSSGLGISELAKSLKMSKSTVHGITSALEDLGTIARDPLTKRYTAGLTLLELGKTAYAQFDLKDIARPVMERLMEAVNESVFLGVLNVEHVTILEIVESGNDLKITSPVGTTMPLFSGAAGKVFLAAMEEERVREIIREKGIPKYTENAITDPDKYLQELARVRENGYATDYEEYLLGVRAVCAPIEGMRHRRSAIWVAGFKTSLDDDKIRILIRKTREAARTISGRIEKQPVL